LRLVSLNVCWMTFLVWAVWFATFQSAGPRGLPTIEESRQRAADVAAMNSEALESLIRETRPKLTGRLDGRSFNVAVLAADAPAGRALGGVLTGLLACDNSYRLIVTQQLLGNIERTEAFIRAQFQTTALVRSAHRSDAIPVRSILVPLSGRWTERGQTFFYEDGAGNEWAACVWSKPDPAAWKTLLQSVALIANQP
jgi:hypothetical protein